MDSPGKKPCVNAEIHQIIQIFDQYWSQLKAGEYYAGNCSKALRYVFGMNEGGTVLGDTEARLTRNL